MCKWCVQMGACVGTCTCAGMCKPLLGNLGQIVLFPEESCISRGVGGALDQAPHRATRSLVTVVPRTTASHQGCGASAQPWLPGSAQLCDTKDVVMAMWLGYSQGPSSLT